jgi:hypothetical protein
MKSPLKKLSFLKKFAVEGQHYNQEHIDSLYHQVINSDEMTYNLITPYDIYSKDNNLSDRVINSLLYHTHSSDDHASILKHQKNLSSDNITNILSKYKNGNHDSDEIAKAALTHKNSTPEHVDYVLKNFADGDDAKYAAAYMSKTPENVWNALRTKDSHVIQSAMNSKPMNREHWNWIADEKNHGDAYLAEYAKGMVKKLSESFDSPSKTTEIPEDSMLHQMGSMSAAMIGGSNFKIDKLDGNGYIIQFDKGGATELHHVDDNLSGGYSTNKSVPIRMVGTFKDRAKALIDAGRRVRIVAHSTLADPFRNITKRIIARNPEYNVSDPVYGRHEITGDKTVSWEISK